MADESYHFDQLTKEIIVAQLKDDIHAPARAAEIACQTIVAGIRGTKAAHSNQDVRESVRQICQGTLAGLLLIEKSLPDGAIALLQNLADSAQKLSLNPSDMMTWAMEGIARLVGTAPPETMHKIQDAINVKFMGAGDVFRELCQKAKRSP